jgi:hypothetical protein
MSMPANIRISAQFPFPATTKGTTPIAVTKANGIWSVALPLDALATQLPSGGSLTTDYLLVWDSLTGTYFKMPVSNVPTGAPGPPGPPGATGPAGGITDAPSDGVNYGRKNATWNNLDTIYAPIAAAAPLDALAYSGMQINGSMEVSQENGTTARTTNGYVVDGVQVAFTGTMTLSCAQVADAPPGLTNSVKVTVTTAEAVLGASDYLVLFQNIEGYRTSRLVFGTANAQPVSIGFWTKIHRTGTYSGSLRNAALNRSYPFTFTQNVSDTWEYKTVTLPGDVIGTWVGNTNGVGLALIFSMACGTTLAGPVNTWAAANYFGATGTTNGVAALTDTFQITGVVVLPGLQLPSAARSPFIMRPFGQELTTCQRYWQSSWNYGGPVGGWTAGLDQILFSHPSGSFAQIVSYVQKRALPTVTIFDNIGTSNKVAYYIAGWASGGALSIVNVKDKFASIQHGIAGSIFTNFAYTADARL